MCTCKIVAEKMLSDENCDNLEMIQGSTICRGIMGIASMASLSLGTPASTNFNPETASAAAKPTLQVSNIAMVVGITESFKMSKSSLYV